MNEQKSRGLGYWVQQYKKLEIDLFPGDIVTVGNHGATAKVVHKHCVKVRHGLESGFMIVTKICGDWRGGGYPFTGLIMIHGRSVGETVGLPVFIGDGPGDEDEYEILSQLMYYHDIAVKKLKNRILVLEQRL